MTRVEHRLYLALKDVNDLLLLMQQSLPQE
jgi:hypothetical protein